MSSGNNNKKPCLYHTNGAVEPSNTPDVGSHQNPQPPDFPSNPVETPLVPAPITMHQEYNWYETFVPRSHEGFLFHYGRANYNGYSTTIVGYCRHSSGEKSWAEQFSAIKNSGDIITAVDGVNMQGASFEGVVNRIHLAGAVLELQLIDVSSTNNISISASGTAKANVFDQSDGISKNSTRNSALGRDEEISLEPSDQMSNTSLEAAKTMLQDPSVAISDITWTDATLSSSIIDLCSSSSDTSDAANINTNLRPSGTGIRTKVTPRQTVNSPNTRVARRMTASLLSPNQNQPHPLFHPSNRSIMSSGAERSVSAIDVITPTIIDVGQIVYAESNISGDGVWYRGKVLKKKSDNKYLIYYFGFSKSFNEELEEHQLFPVHNIKRGGRVYGFWRDENDDSLGNWYPGTVVECHIAKKTTKNLKGSRVYHIQFDDGDVDTRMQEINVMPFDMFDTFLRKPWRACSKKGQPIGLR